MVDPNPTNTILIYFSPFFRMLALVVVKNFWLLIPGNIFIFGLVEGVKAYFRTRRKSDKHGIPNLIIISSVFILGIVYAWGLGRYQNEPCSEKMIYQGVFLASLNIFIYLVVQGVVNLWKWWKGRGKQERRK